MDIHERLTNFQIPESTFLDVLLDEDAEGKSVLVEDLAKKYIAEACKGNASMKNLETCRILLCRKYRSLINSKKRKSSPVDLSSDNHSPDFATFFTKAPSEKFLESEDTYSLVHDIIALRSSLYSDYEQLVRSVINFYDSTMLDARVDRLPGTQTREERGRWGLRAIECFADICILRSHLYAEETNFGSNQCELQDKIQHTIRHWLIFGNNSEWQRLTSLLQKCTLLLGYQTFFIKMWLYVVTELKDLDRQLIVLCIMSDVCFQWDVRSNQGNYDHCLFNLFWNVLARAIESPVYYHRKQGIYLMKAALRFVESHDSEIRKSEAIDGKMRAQVVVPFFCTNPSIEGDIAKQAKSHFFLILESLEEKQKHLVLPALMTYLDILVKLYSERKAEGCAFQGIWLRCILKRIMSHTDGAVKIIGLQEALEADLEIYDDDAFLIILVEALDHLELYDYDPSSETQPRIVTRLENFFFRSERSALPLINNFIIAVAKKFWCPIAVYWILRAIVGVTERLPIVHNIWTEATFYNIESFVIMNLTKHDKRLQANSQWLTLRALLAYNNQDSMNFRCLRDIVNTIYTCSPQILKSTDENNVEKIMERFKLILGTVEAQSLPADLSSPNETQAQALWILLLTKSGFTWETDVCSAKLNIYGLFENLDNINRRPYGNLSATVYTIRLLHDFNQIIRCIPEFENPIIKSLTLEYKERMLHLLESSFESTIKLPHSSYLELADIYEFDRQRNETFVRKCEQIIINQPRENSNDRWFYAIKFLYFCKLDTKSTKEAFSRSIIAALRYLKNDRLHITHHHRGNNEEPHVNAWTAIAKLINKFLKSVEKEEWFNHCSRSNMNWLEELRCIEESGDYAVIIPTIEATDTFLQLEEFITPTSKITPGTLLRATWISVFEMKRTKLFWDSVRCLASFMMSPTFLKYEENFQLSSQFADRLVEEGKNVPMFLYTFLSGICLLDNSLLLRFRKQFTSCLLHEPVLRHDQKIVQATMSRLRSFKKITMNEGSLQESIKERAENHDIHCNIRGLALTILLRCLDKCKQDEPDILYGIVTDIVSLLEKNRNKRYFDHSYLHRVKNRGMQILLTIQPFLESEGQNYLREKISDLLIAESNQPSVRMLQEWLIVSIYNTTENHDDLWRLFAKAQEIRSGSIVSLAGISFHRAKCLSGENRDTFVRKAISNLLPNCMSQQFNVRLYSQVILMKMWEMLESRPEDGSEIYKAVQQSLTHGNLVKNAPKIMDNFYFAAFDMVQHHSFQIIYYDFPRLTNLPPDEWIDLKRDLYPCEFRRRALESYNSHSSMKVLRDWPTPVTQTPRAEGDADEDEENSMTSGPSDIQRKAIPWKSMFPISEELLKILPGRSEDRGDSGIIVVASLVEKSANLGGIARTCEIFGARELVFRSLKSMENHEFQTLSVSAEKWIKVTEVKPHLLKNYLLEQRSNGWKLIGAEQTANSTNLLDMRFDKKTILILGNEKNGIPANLIPLLDTCVEIPQRGVVRSLNVHVTSAIFMWQYAIQHSFSHK